MVHGTTPKTLSLNQEKHLLTEVYVKSTTESFQHVTKEHNNHEFATYLPELSSAVTSSVENLHIIVSHTANGTNPIKENNKYPGTLATVTNNKQAQLAPAILIIEGINHNETEKITHTIDSLSEETRLADEIHIQDKKNASKPERNDHLIQEIEDSALNIFETNVNYTHINRPSNIIAGSNANVTKDIKENTIYTGDEYFDIVNDSNRVKYSSIFSHNVDANKTTNYAIDQIERSINFNETPSSLQSNDLFSANMLYG